MAILFYVGVDKGGKSTLFRGVLKKTNRHICVDRFTPCQYVYGRLHGKSDTPGLPELKNLESFLSQSPIPAAFIYIEADTSEIIERFKQHNEEDIQINQIDHVKDMYLEYLNASALPVLKINTTGKTIKSCIKAIIEWADRLDKEEVE